MPGLDDDPTRGVIGPEHRQIYFEIHGHGAPLLLLHGYSQSSVVWMPLVAQLTAQFQVILVDLPGHGNAGAYRSPFSVTDAAESVAELLESRAIKSVSAVGFSFGGDVLFQLALAQPNLVRALVSASSTGSWNIDDHPDIARMFTAENVDITALHQDEAQVAKIFENFSGYRVRLTNEDLASIPCPVLLVVGENDPSIRPDELTRARTHLPDVEAQIVPGAYHMPHESPGFAESVAAFIDRAGT